VGLPETIAELVATAASFTVTNPAGHSRLLVRCQAPTVE